MATFTTRVPLRWGDMDALGHVNNVVHLQLLEEARVRFLMSLAGETQPTFGMVAVRHEIDYPKPLLYSEEPVVIETWVARIGNSSFTVAYQMRDGAGDLVASATTVVVATTLDGGSSVPLPEDARQRLAPYLA